MIAMWAGLFLLVWTVLALVNSLIAEFVQAVTHGFLENKGVHKPCPCPRVPHMHSVLSLWLNPLIDVMVACALVAIFDRGDWLGALLDSTTLVPMLVLDIYWLVKHEKGKWKRKAAKAAGRVRLNLHGRLVVAH